MTLGRPLLLRAAVAVLVAATPVAAGAAVRVPAAGPVPSYEQCYAATPSQAGNLAAACRGFEKFGQDASALCRRVLQDDARCETPFAPAVERDEVRAYQQSWTHRALLLQQALGDTLPLRAAQWLGTHNSFNAVPDGADDPPPGLSQLDSNQQLSMVDQLGSDMRSLEVDAHWALDPQTGQDEVRLCHAQPGGYGCTIEGTLAQGLAPVADWVKAHDEVLFLYVDDDLQEHAGYEAAAAVVEKAFGPLIYHPSGPPGACHDLDLDLTRAQVLAAGKRVLVWSSCEAGTPAGGSSWNDLVFSDGKKFEETAAAYADFPACDGAAAQAKYGKTFVRYFEDSTFLSALATPDGHKIDAPMAAHMARCGVNLTGFDQLLPADDRLAASVWSWAPDEPSTAGDCAVAESSDGRFVAVPCTGTPRPVACRSGGTWTVVTPAVARSSAASLCAAKDAGVFDVPRSGREGALLQAALRAAHVPAAWVAYDDTGSGWTPVERREL